MEDKVWQEQYKKYKGLSDDEWACGPERFRDNDTLKYVLRSIDKHMPWINKLHIIVASESQIPNWINRKEVDFILHNEFIPEINLPTFNSGTIETFLPLAPRITNNFIYSNDDLICFRDLLPQDFFNKGRPKYSINLRDYNYKFPGDKLRRQAYSLILGSQDRVVQTQHGPTVFKKKWIKECYDKYKNILNDSTSKFREDKNYNQYLYAFYQMMIKAIDNSQLNIKSFYLSPENYGKILETNFSEFDFACFNDSNDTDENYWDLIRIRLNKLFPNKCKYEL